MFRRILAALVANIAVLLITTSFFVWIFDTYVLNQRHLTEALRTSGVAKAIADVIPDLTTQGVPIEQQQIVRDASKNVLTPEYIDEKLSLLAVGTIAYLKGESNPPALDLTDLGDRLARNNAMLPADTLKSLSKPIEIGNTGVFKALPKTYVWLRRFKKIGPIIAVLMLIAEWFLSAARARFGRLARICYHVGFWSFGYVVMIYLLPKLVDSKISNNVGTVNSVNKILQAVVDAAKTLIGRPFVYLGAISFGLAVIFMIIGLVRNRKQKQQAVTPNVDQSAGPAMRSIQSTEQQESQALAQSTTLLVDRAPTQMSSTAQGTPVETTSQQKLGE